MTTDTQDQRPEPITGHRYVTNDDIVIRDPEAPAAGASTMTPAEKQKRRTAKRATQQPNETEETENPRPWPHEHHFPEYVKQLREKALPELQKIVNQHPRINRHSRGITVTNYALHPKAQVDSHANISIHRDSITKEWTGGMALPLDEGRLASLIAHERRRYYDEMFGKLPNRLQARNANKRNHFEDMEYRKNLTALRGEIVDSLMPEDQRTADRQLAREMLAQLDQQELKAATELLGRGAELHDLTRLGEARACLKTAKGVDWEGSWDGSWDPDWDGHRNRIAWWVGTCRQDRWQHKIPATMEDLLEQAKVSFSLRHPEVKIWGRNYGQNTETDWAYIENFDPNLFRNKDLPPVRALMHLREMYPDAPPHTKIQEIMAKDKEGAWPSTFHPRTRQQLAPWNQFLNEQLQQVEAQAVSESWKPVELKRRIADITSPLETYLKIGKTLPWLATETQNTVCQEKYREDPAGLDRELRRIMNCPPLEPETAGEGASSTGETAKSGKAKGKGGRTAATPKAKQPRPAPRLRSGAARAKQEEAERRARMTEHLESPAAQARMKAGLVPETTLTPDKDYPRIVASSRMGGPDTFMLVNRWDNGMIRPRVIGGADDLAPMWFGHETMPIGLEELPEAQDKPIGRARHDYFRWGWATQLLTALARNELLRHAPELAEARSQATEASEETEPGPTGQGTEKRKLPHCGTPEYNAANRAAYHWVQNLRSEWQNAWEYRLRRGLVQMFLETAEPQPLEAYRKLMAECRVPGHILQPEPVLRHYNLIAAALPGWEELYERLPGAAMWWLHRSDTPSNWKQEPLATSGSRLEKKVRQEIRAMKLLQPEEQEGLLKMPARLISISHYGELHTHQTSNVRMKRCREHISDLARLGAQRPGQEWPDAPHAVFGLAMGISDHLRRTPSPFNPSIPPAEAEIARLLLEALSRSGDNPQAPGPEYAIEPHGNWTGLIADAIGFYTRRIRAKADAARQALPQDTPDEQKKAVYEAAYRNPEREFRTWRDLIRAMLAEQREKEAKAFRKALGKLRGQEKGCYHAWENKIQKYLDEETGCTAHAVPDQIEEIRVRAKLDLQYYPGDIQLRTKENYHEDYERLFVMTTPLGTMCLARLGPVTEGPQQPEEQGEWDCLSFSYPKHQSDFHERELLHEAGERLALAYQEKVQEKKHLPVERLPIPEGTSY